MTGIRICLVATPQQADRVSAIAARLPITGLLNPTRSPWKEAPVRLCSHLDELLQEADICCFLTPYPGLARDLQGGLERGVHLLCAGPPPLSLPSWKRLSRLASREGRQLAWGGRHRRTRLHQVLQSQLPGAFGNPVFLRLVGGGGQGRLNAWWAACQALEQAVDLLQSPIAELLVAGVRRGHNFHLALTVAAVNQATAQLVVAPCHPSPLPDIFLVGTGGLLTSTEFAQTPTVTTSQGTTLNPAPPPFAEPDWLQDFARRIPDPTFSPDQAFLAICQALKHSLDLAIRQAKPIPVPIPPSPR